MQMQPFSMILLMLGGIIAIVSRAIIVQISAMLCPADAEVIQRRQ
jgi:hypothetical protein